MYQVIKYIHEHIKENLLLSDVAEKFGYSKWHFCVKFSEYTGISFVKYVRHFKLRLASFDIISGKKITDVALDYGYDSVGGFNKAFLAEFGCYPSSYKKIYYERINRNMFQLSDRCELLRQTATNPNEYEKLYCAHREVYSRLGQHEASQRGLTNPEIIGRGLANVIDKSSPVIIPCELIVGVHFPVFMKHWGFSRADENDTELFRASKISDADRDLYFDIIESLPHLPHPGEIPFTDDLIPNLNEVEINSELEWSAIGRCIVSDHSVINYEKVVKIGYGGILKEIEEYEAKNGSNPTYRAMKDICLSACAIGKKYAEEAKKLLESGDDRYVAEDLCRVIDVCQNVPEHGARNLHEAIQSLWFSHMINTWEDTINANSVGRLDQIFYPYYKADLENGTLTKDEAFELICCLWLKLYHTYDVQQSCVGGTSPDGECQVNELSYMMLDATEQLDFIRCMSVRYSQNTPKEFIKRALEVVGHVQKGVPFFFNDDVMIPALEYKGISHEDACDYTQIGCVETVIPGKSNPHAVAGEINVLKAIEYVLGNGYSLMYPEMKNGVSSGELEALDTYEKFYDAALKQVYKILDTTCSAIKKRRECFVQNCPRPFKSMLTDGCIERGKDFNDAGALYDYYQVMIGGIPNFADSMEVIRKFVYQERKYTLSELKEILVNDYPDESVRQTFINKAAKFGNDINSVDSIAVDLVNKCCDYLDELSEKYSLSFHAQPFTYLWMIEHGRESAASADGRRKGEVIAYSVSPMQGRDFNGLTAVFNSIAKLPTKRTPGTTSAIIEIDPKLFTDCNIPLLAEILLAASAKGLSNVQFNVVDADILMDAQNHPEKYNNLAVRVSGFSQKFNLISPDLQDHIIARTKHSCF